MSIQQQQYIQTLVEKSEKLSLYDFFKIVHTKFYSNQDISFMEYFLDLTAHEGFNGLVEDYLLRDISEQVV